MEKLKRITFDIAATTAKQIKEIAKRENRSVSKQIRVLIQSALDGGAK